MPSPRPAGTVPSEVVQLAESGARMFPLSPHSKIPYKDWKWKEENSSDPIELEKYAHDRPGCNWAMKTGADSRRFLLDYDCKDPRKNGLEWYQHNLEEHGVEWADTLRYRTPSGGLHDHFAWPRTFEIGCDNTGRLAPGVDVKGNGGYAVTPPSEVDGKRYYFEDCNAETGILPAPDWLLQELYKVFAARVRAGGQETREQQKIPAGVGQRHGILLEYGKKLARIGACYEAILRQFEILNQGFEDRYAHSELERQARDMYERYQKRVFFGGRNGAQPMDATGELILVPFSEIKPEPVYFLKEPYIPRGMLTMLTGDPGVGKSYIGESLAAEVTRQGGIVFYLTLENHPRKVLRPRFDVLNGDPTRIFWIKAVQFGDPEDGEVRTVTLDDIAGLDKKVQEYQASLIIIDPLQSFLGANIDAWRPNETRPVLDRLVELAERRELSILILRHGTKAQTGRIIHRGLGSIDFTGAVRSELYAGETADKKEKAMAHIKSNIGPLGPTLGYKITPMDAQGTVYRTGYFEWTGESELKTADLTEPEPTEEEVSALDEAKSFLQEYLSDGAKERDLVIKRSRVRSIAYRTLRRAKKDLQVGLERRDGMVFWTLPSLYT